MSVYVDKSANSFGRMVMCHMIADTPEELRAMAERIGVALRWFQSDASMPHFDLAKSKKELAIQAGAIELTAAPYVDAMKRIRQTWPVKDGRWSLDQGGDQDGPQWKIRHIGHLSLCQAENHTNNIQRIDLGATRYRQLGVRERYKDEAPYRVWQAVHCQTSRRTDQMSETPRSFHICADHQNADWNQPALDDASCILCRLFYLEAQECLLEEWQQRATRAEQTIAEIQRPLDAQMSRLNETVTRLNSEKERLERELAAMTKRHEVSHAEVLRLAESLRKVDPQFQSAMHTNSAPTEAVRSDTERLDWLSNQVVTIYRGESGGHWVFVDETAKTRKGIVETDLRNCIDSGRSSMNNSTEGG